MPRHRKKGIKGAGSVYPRKDGRWVAKFKVEETGKYKELYAKTEKEAYEKLQQALLEQKQGRLATGPQQKLGDYIDRWLEEVHRPIIRDSTWYRYRGLIDNYIIPELGEVQLQKLKPQQIQSFYTKIHKQGISAISVRKMHQILHRALDNAVRWRLVSYNACNDVTPPRAGKREAQPLTIEQAHQLLKTARGHRLETMIILALTTGMRIGELLGLQWKDIDLEQGTLQVRRTVNRVGTLGVVETNPKTAKSKRTIILTKFAVEALRRHRVQMAEVRLKAGVRWEQHDWVFCNIYGRLLESVIVHRLFIALLRKAGLPHIHFHDVRRFGDCKIALKGQKVRAITF